MTPETLKLIQISLGEAILARDDILRYHVKHPDVHDPLDIDIYRKEMIDMQNVLKGLM